MRSGQKFNRKERSVNAGASFYTGITAEFVRVMSHEPLFLRRVRG